MAHNEEFHHIFHEALVRFCEFHGYHVGEALVDIFGDDGCQVIEVLNAYLKTNLTHSNPDIRIVNLVLKFSRPFLGVVSFKGRQLYANLHPMANRFFEVRLPL